MVTNKIILLPRKEGNSLIGVDEAIAGNNNPLTVWGNNPMVFQVHECIVPNLRVSSKPDPDAIETAANLVADDVISGAKTQLDPIIKVVLDCIADYLVVVAAGLVMCLEKNPIPVSASHPIVRNQVVA
jgi:hypothetical protein